MKFPLYGIVKDRYDYHLQDTKTSADGIGSITVPLQSKYKNYSSFTWTPELPEKFQNTVFLEIF